MPSPREITESKQLIVEGKDAKYFFRSFIKYESLKAIQVQNFGGKDEMRGFLKALRNMSKFTHRVTSLGIVRDAEEDPTATFQSVSGALKDANLPMPSEPLERTGDNPTVSIFILPDNKTPGMLETICLQSVHDDPAIGCIDQFFTCVEQKVGSLPKNMYKARVQAFLASKEKPGLRLAEAADKGYWPWEDPTFDLIKKFLRAL